MKMLKGKKGFGLSVLVVGALVSLNTMTLTPLAHAACTGQPTDDCDGDGWTRAGGDCNDLDAALSPSAPEICNDVRDNNCNFLIDMEDLECLFPCSSDWQCGDGRFCKKTVGNCGGNGLCNPLPTAACAPADAPVCGCDGVTYANECEATIKGVSVASAGACAATTYSWKYYFPSIKDEAATGWANYITVQAKEAVTMEVRIKVYNMAGTLMGTYTYSDVDPAANEPAIKPNARVAQRASWIAGTLANPVDIEGSISVETNVPAIASTNAIASNYGGFSLYEAAKVRPIHAFPKNYDGPNRFQVYILVQNIYTTPRSVTVRLFGKYANAPGDGAMQTYTIPPKGTLKVRPSDIAGGIDFDGSVIVYSNLNYATDGYGLPVPAMNRYEVGQEALAIYESTIPQNTLTFPVLKDGSFGGALDYQNFLSVVNPGLKDATINISLYNKDGVTEGTVVNEVIPAGGKKTWRPSWIKGTLATPVDFEGTAVIHSNLPVVGQTNTIYPGGNIYLTDAFDLIESSILSKTLFFPKAFDNFVTDNRLVDNYVFIQNPDSTPKSITIEQFNNNGSANGSTQLTLGPYAMHKYQPRSLVTDGTNLFRGSVKVTEASGLNISGALKYDIHVNQFSYYPVTSTAIYRSMGQ